jgi:hypothetical protein
MTTKPKRKAPAPAGIPDPAFALIDVHKARTKEWCRLYDKLDEAEFEAGRTHGKRPWELIALRGQEERALAAVRKAAMRMARTKPTTLAGAAALISYTRRDIMEGEVDWQMVALKTAASALTRMVAS